MKSGRNVSGKDVALTFLCMALFIAPFFVLPQLDLAPSTKWIVVFVYAAAMGTMWIVVSRSK
jgi:hypothetical protein